MPTIDVDIHKIVQVLYEALLDPATSKIEPLGSGRITLDPFQSDEIRRRMQSIIVQRASLGQCVACGQDIHACLYESPCGS